MDPRDRVADVLRRPGAYGLRTFEQATAFMVGFDAALDWKLLHGFREWLAQELGEAENLAWPILAARIPEVSLGDDALREDITEPSEGKMVGFFDAVRRFLDIS